MADSILGRFVWHELMSADPKAAGSFFSKVIGWRLQPWGEDKSYTMFMAGKSGMGGLMGLPEKSTPPMWMTYIATPDLNATLKKITANGGKVLKGATPIPTIGTFAVVQDPQGAVFAAFTPEGGPSGPQPPAAVMDFSWHELATTDPDGSLSFYQSVFGWKPTDAMDMGPMGKYQMYGLGGRTLGGIFRKPAEMPGPPAWLAYTRVADAKKTASAITKAGGKIINGPMEVPGGDLIAQALDPQGVMFAVHSVAVKAPVAVKKAARKTAKKAAKKAARKTVKKAARTSAKKTKPAGRKSAATKAKSKSARKKTAPSRAARASKQRATKRSRR